MYLQAQLKVFSADVMGKDGLQKDLTVAYNLGSKIADKGVQRDSGKTSFLFRPFSKSEDAAKVTRRPYHSLHQVSSFWSSISVSEVYYIAE